MTLFDHDAPARRVATARWLDEADDEGDVQVVQSAEPVESFIDVGQWLTQQIEAARETRAAPGSRLGPTPEPTFRTGTREEVVAPVALRPQTAVGVIRRGRLFDPPIDSLDISAGTFENRGLSCSWQATVRMSLFRTRRATLQIGPSRSGNLTVLQLIPSRARRLQRGTFVEVGVNIVQTVGQRLLDDARGTTRSA